MRSCSTRANTACSSGTPNSTTTSLSALSTTAIKDGHKGHAPPHQHHRTDSMASESSTNTLDAERADRISRLAGLERVSTVRGANSGPGTELLEAGRGNSTYAAQPSGYFDHAGNPVLAKERSTVGSASATGSAGGRTTWASGSDMMLDGDKMSEDDGVSSVGGFSDEGNASLVGFGEAANSVRGSAAYGPASVSTGGQSPMQGLQQVRSTEGVADRTPGRSPMDTTDSTTAASVDRVMQSPDDNNGLGKFYFEEKK